MKLATVRKDGPAASQQKQIGKTLLTGKPYTPAAAHADPRYMTGRMDYYRQMVAKEKR